MTSWSLVITIVLHSHNVQPSQTTIPPEILGIYDTYDIFLFVKRTSVNKPGAKWLCSHSQRCLHPIFALVHLYLVSLVNKPFKYRVQQKQLTQANWCDSKVPSVDIFEMEPSCFSLQSMLRDSASWF